MQLPGEKAVNLNRQFMAEGPTHRKAEQLLEILDKMPELKYVFSWHGDNERVADSYDPVAKAATKVPSGFYVYDCPHYQTAEDGPIDYQEDEIVQYLMDALRLALKVAGIPLLTGYDEVGTHNGDPALGNFFNEGYARVAASCPFKGDWEPYLSYLGKQAAEGKVPEGQKPHKIKRTFCFETPGWLSMEQKNLVAEIARDYFIVPFLALTKQSDEAK